MKIHYTGPGKGRLPGDPFLKRWCIFAQRRRRVFVLRAHARALARASVDNIIFFGAAGGNRLVEDILLSYRDDSINAIRFQKTDDQNPPAIWLQSFKAGTREVSPTLRQELVEQSKSHPILLIISEATPQWTREAVRCRASGVLTTMAMNTLGASGIADLVKDLALTRRYFFEIEDLYRAVAELLTHRSKRLSQRQFEYLALKQLGFQTGEIADIWGITKHGVDSQAKRIRKHYNIGQTSDAIAIVEADGINLRGYLSDTTRAKLALSRPQNATLPFL